MKYNDNNEGDINMLRKIKQRHPKERRGKKSESIIAFASATRLGERLQTIRTNKIGPIRSLTETTRRTLNPGNRDGNQGPGPRAWPVKACCVAGLDLHLVSP
ncbi:hypothetical protein YC2023_099674 [Brassica napus]